MKKLTEEQIDFLIKNDDRYTIGEFASCFKCSGKELYEIYDRITRTKRYQEYIQSRASRITEAIKNGGRKYEKMERSKENRRIARKVSDRLPLIYISNNTYDNLLNNYSLPFD